MEKISAVQDDINEVTDIMRHNIEKAVQRGEQLEMVSLRPGSVHPLRSPRLSACNDVSQLVDKSQGLNANARAFQKQSAGLKNALWWKNCRIVLSLLCVIFLLALGILVLKCGWTLQSCQRLTEG